MNETVKKLLELLDECGEPTYKVEKNAGISSTSFQGWKNERFKPSTEAIVKLARYFNVSTDYLLGLSDERNTQQPIQQQSSSLTARESELLSVFNSLSPSEQGRVLGYAKGLAEKSQSDVG